VGQRRSDWSGACHVHRAGGSLSQFGDVIQEETAPQNGIAWATSGALVATASPDVESSGLTVGHREVKHPRRMLRKNCRKVRQALALEVEGDLGELVEGGFEFSQSAGQGARSRT